MNLKNTLVWLLVCGLLVAPEAMAGDIEVSVKKAARMQAKDASVLLVDTRPDEAYRNCHIPGSIRIAPEVLTEKTFLKHRTVVLMGRGLEDESLQAAAGELRGKQVRAFVMTGGLNSWIASGRFVTGSPFDKIAVSTVAPRELSEGLQNRIPILVEEAGDATKQNRIRVPDTSDKAAWIRLETDLKAYPKTDPVLLASSDSDAVMNRLRKAGWTNLFVLEGGTPALERWERTLAAVSQRTGEKRMIGEDCAPCAQKRLMAKSDE